MAAKGYWTRTLIDSFEARAIPSRSPRLGITAKGKSIDEINGASTGVQSTILSQGWQASIGGTRALNLDDQGRIRDQGITMLHNKAVSMFDLSILLSELLDRRDIQDTISRYSL